MKRLINALILSFTLLGILVSSADAQIGRGKFGIGLSLAGNTLQSDWKSADLGLGASVDASYSIGDNWGLVSGLGTNSFSGKNSVNSYSASKTLYQEAH